MANNTVYYVLILDAMIEDVETPPTVLKVTKSRKAAIFALDYERKKIKLPSLGILPGVDDSESEEDKWQEEEWKTDKKIWDPYTQEWIIRKSTFEYDNYVRLRIVSYNINGWTQHQKDYNALIEAKVLNKYQKNEDEEDIENEEEEM